MIAPPYPNESLESVAMAQGLDPDTELEFFGRHKAKLRPEALERLEAARTPARLVLVSAITPTPAGEGKTTISIGLAQGLKASGRSAAIALRQPSMGPVFGRKGGAAGGGRSTLFPEDDLNFHFTGDFHAVTAAHNLLASIIDNRLRHEATKLRPENVTWKRVLDVNDGALRRIRVGVGDPRVERDSGFDITAASEIMAILCLSRSADDLRNRLNRMIVGHLTDGTPVTAGEMAVTGALMAVLRDAIKPNLVQSVEGVPAFVHGGPFANIAHGCNSVLATRFARATADYAVTEAGFAFDLGGEKFIHIKCRQSGLSPDVVVLVATIRALKMHGGVPLDDLERPDAGAVERGLENLAAHLDAAAQFRLPVVVALNRFAEDTADEESVVRRFCSARGVRFAAADIHARGGPGGIELAEAVVDASNEAPGSLDFLYELDDPLPRKIEAIAARIYGADGVDFTEAAAARLRILDAHGLTRGLPVCMAKTQQSLSDDPARLGRPSGFRITVRDLEPAMGAGFIVALTGKMLRMPALPKVPAAEHIDVAPDGTVIRIDRGEGTSPIA